MYFATTDSYATGAKTFLNSDHLGQSNFTRSFTTSVGSFRAPIFYDSDNTGYYLDPTGSTSVRIAGDIRSDSSAWTGESAGKIQYHNNTWYLQFSGGIIGRRNDGADLFTVNSGGTVSAVGDFRAPIFYDSNNTAFFTDPASTSVLSALTVNGGTVFRSNWISEFQSISDFTNGTLVTTDIPATAENGDSFLIEITGKSYGGGPSTKVIAEGYLYANTIINFAGISYGGPFASYIRVFQDGGVLKFWWPRISYWNSFNIRVISMDGATNENISRNRVTAIADSTEPTGSKKVTITLATNMRADISATNSADLRAPIFYDSNDTGYYVDPASTSKLFDLNVEGTGNKYLLIYSTSGSEAMVRYIGGTGNGWYVGKRVTGQLVGTESFHFYSEAAGATVAGIDTGGNIFSSGSVRSPIFYDSNNTAYYLDPAGTESGFLRGTLRFGDFGAGIVGQYDSFRYQLVFAMGDAYKGALDGTNVTSGYGLWWSHPNAGGVAANLNNHGLMNIVNGTWQASFAGSTRALDDMRTPIYYDLNDTGYYVDPNGTSRLGTVQMGNTLNLNGWQESVATTSFRGIEFHSVGDRTYYIGKDAGAWTQPLTIAFFTGIRYFASQDYNGSRFFNSNNGSMLFSIGDGDGSVRVTNDIRSPIYYDSNNTAFFLNPDSTSNITHLQLGGVLALTGSGATLGNSTGARLSENYGPLWNLDNSATWHHQVINGSMLCGFTAAGANWGNGRIVASGDMRAPIFYDQNDTGRFLDPNGTSQLVGTTLITNSSNAGAFGGLENREINFGGAMTGALTESPRVNWHWGGRDAASIMFNSSGQFVFAGFQDINSNRRSIIVNEVFATGDVTAFWSDDRLKTKLGNIENALDIVSLLNGFRYVNNEKAKEFGFDSEKTQLGLSAQEVEKVLPELVELAVFDRDMDSVSPVSRTGENYKTIQYNRLIPVLIEAIKEQQTHINNLQEQINSLKEDK
jgi:hypothetical protein